MKKPILCVDWDGVIHSYTSGWKGETVIPDPPVKGAIKWLWKSTEWFDVQIYSSRSKSPDAIIEMKRWLVRHSADELGIDHPMAGGPVDGFNVPYPIKFASEKPAAFLTIDDRAICFEGDWSELEPADLLNFRPWNKRRPAPPAVYISSDRDHLAKEFAAYRAKAEAIAAERDEWKRQAHLLRDKVQTLEELLGKQAEDVRI